MTKNTVQPPNDRNKEGKPGSPIWQVVREQ